MNNIKEMRKALKLTQADFSEIFGIPKRTLEDWEAGRRQPAPYVEHLLRLSCEAVMKDDRKRDALERSDVNEIKLVREGGYYTIYIDGMQCDCGLLYDQITSLDEWLESGRTLPEYVEASQITW